MAVRPPAQYLHARADSELVKLFRGGILVKTHPRQLPGQRSTDRADLPADKTVYAMRDLDTTPSCRQPPDTGGASASTPSGCSMIRCPGTRMRAVYRLLGLVRRHGPGPVEAACSRALDLDVVSVPKIASMLARATENDTTTLPEAAGAGGRFARDPGEFAMRGPTQLTLIRGGAAGPETTR